MSIVGGSKHFSSNGNIQHTTVYVAGNRAILWPCIKVLGKEELNGACQNDFDLVPMIREIRGSDRGLLYDTILTFWRGTEKNREPQSGRLFQVRQWAWLNVFTAVSIFLNHSSESPMLVMSRPKI
jgi:hypothetical protein